MGLYFFLRDFSTPILLYAAAFAVYSGSAIGKTGNLPDNFFSCDWNNRITSAHRRHGRFHFFLHATLYIGMGNHTNLLYIFQLSNFLET